MANKYTGFGTNLETTSTTTHEEGTCEHCGEVVHTDNFNIAWGMCNNCLSANKEHKQIKKRQNELFKRMLNEF